MGYPMGMGYGGYGRYGRFGGYGMGMYQQENEQGDQENLHKRDEGAGDDDSFMMGRGLYSGALYGYPGYGMGYGGYGGYGMGYGGYGMGYGGYGMGYWQKEEESK